MGNYPEGGRRWTGLHMLSLPQPVHGHTLALGWEQGDSVCPFSGCLLHCAGLQPGPAAAEGGTLHPWHHSQPLGTQHWPYRESLD